MTRMTARLIWVTLALCGIAYLFLLFLSMYQFSPQAFELIYRGRWAADNGLILLIKYFPALQASAILICYSLFYKPALKDAVAEVISFQKLVLFSLLLFLISTLGGFLLNEIVAPGAHARQFRRLEDTRITRNLQILAEEAERMGEYGLAVEYYKNLTGLRPDDKEALEIKTADLEKKRDQMDSESPDSGVISRMRDRSPGDLLSEARQFAIKEDYFSAYYYSSLAYQIDDQFVDAREFASRMWAKIESLTPMTEDLDRAYIFSQKKEGTELLSAGKPLDAYYLFLMLKDEVVKRGFPQDADIIQYLETARQLCLEISFFQEDVFTLMAAPGYRDLVFRNRDSVNGREATEIVCLGKAVPHIPSRGTWMAKDIRVIRYNEEGVRYSFTAPYGKILFGTSADSRGKLVMHGIVPGDRADNYHVAYLEGNERLELEDTLPLYLGIREIETLAEESTDLSMTNLFWLWNAEGVLDEAGIPSDRIHLKILEKILYPFSFLILCLFSVTFGWRLRQRDTGPIPATFLLFPLLPSLVYRLFELYTAANVSLLSFIRDLGGFIPAFTALLIIQGVVLVFSFILLAGQRS